MYTTVFQMNYNNSEKKIKEHIINNFLNLFILSLKDNCFTEFCSFL